MEIFVNAMVLEQNGHRCQFTFHKYVLTSPFYNTHVMDPSYTWPGPKWISSNNDHWWMLSDLSSRNIWEFYIVWKWWNISRQSRYVSYSYFTAKHITRVNVKVDSITPSNSWIYDKLFHRLMIAKIHQVIFSVDIFGLHLHYNDVMMSTMASQIASVSIVYSTVCSDADQRKHQRSALLAFVRGIHRGPVNSPYKGPVTRKIFPFDDVIMIYQWHFGPNEMLQC